MRNSKIALQHFGNRDVKLCKNVAAELALLDLWAKQTFGQSKLCRYGMWSDLLLGLL